jgi:hypothetical protein
MRFSEYEFDVTRLWEARETRDNDHQAPKLTTQPRRPPRTVDAEVVQFPRRAKIPANDAATDAASCRKQTRAELLSIAMSLRARDAIRRSWIAARCGDCRRCPDMVD